MNTEAIVENLAFSLQDLLGQLVYGHHAPTRAQLLNAVSALEKANMLRSPETRISETVFANTRTQIMK